MSDFKSNKNVIRGDVKLPSSGKIDRTGSTSFGDSYDDTHQRMGELIVDGYLQLKLQNTFEEGFDGDDTQVLITDSHGKVYTAPAKETAFAKYLTTQIGTVLDNLDLDALNSLSQTVEEFQNADASLTQKVVEYYNKALVEIAAETTSREQEDTKTREEISNITTQVGEIESSLQTALATDVVKLSERINTTNNIIDTLLSTTSSDSNGTYLPPVDTNYLSESVSIIDAATKLDNEVQKVASALATKTTELRSHFDEQYRLLQEADATTSDAISSQYKELSDLIAGQATTTDTMGVEIQNVISLITQESSTRNRDIQHETLLREKAVEELEERVSLHDTTITHNTDYITKEISSIRKDMKEDGDKDHLMREDVTRNTREIAEERLSRTQTIDLLQAEVNTTQAAIGLDAEGKYVPTTGKYISSSNSLRAACVDLNEAIEAVDIDLSSFKGASEETAKMISTKVKFLTDSLGFQMTYFAPGTRYISDSTSILGADKDLDAAIYINEQAIEETNEILVESIIERDEKMHELETTIGLVKGKYPQNSTGVSYIRHAQSFNHADRILDAAIHETSTAINKIIPSEEEVETRNAPSTLLEAYEKSIHKSQELVDKAIEEITGGAPEFLNTFREIQAELENNYSKAATIIKMVNNTRVGAGLNKNDGAYDNASGDLTDTKYIFDANSLKEADIILDKAVQSVAASVEVSREEQLKKIVFTITDTEYLEEEDVFSCTIPHDLKTSDLSVSIRESDTGMMAMTAIRYSEDKVELFFSQEPNPGKYVVTIIG